MERKEVQGLLCVIHVRASSVDGWGGGGGVEGGGGGVTVVVVHER